MQCGNRLCMCFVDLVAVHLISCIEIIVGSVLEHMAKSWRHDIVVLSEKALCVVMYDSCVVNEVSIFGGVGLCGIGSGMNIKNSLHQNAYV